MVQKPSRHLPGLKTASRPTEQAVGSVTERIGATPERLAHAALAGDDAIVETVTEVTDRNGRSERASTRRLLDGDVLELLLKRSVIDSEQYGVGKEFRRHWECSRVGSAGVMDMERERVDGGQFKPESEVQLWHLTKWRKMVEQLGQIHSNVMCTCVLLDTSMQDFGDRNSGQKDKEKARTWAQARLTAALEQLVLNELGPKHTRRGASMMVDGRPVIQPRENAS